MVQYVTMKRAESNNGARASRGRRVRGGASGQVATEYLLLVSVLAVAVTWLMIYALDDALQGFFDEIAAWVSLPFP